VVVRDDDTKVIDCQLLELALLWREEEAVFSELTEHLSDDLPVMGEVGVCDEDVIKVDHDVSRQDKVLEDVVHHLEGSHFIWSV
jgi:hypothetical protein